MAQTDFARRSKELGPMAGLEQKILRLQGPILVLGASGFVGANLLRALLAHRSDVYGTASRLPAWRLDGLPRDNVLVVDLLVDANLDKMIAQVQPRTVFDCVAYGAYPFETNSELIYRTNLLLAEKIISRLAVRNIAAYVHAGSSSEYGDSAAGPSEDQSAEPNSDYSVSKLACANLIRYYGRKKGLACANLRLYSVYGPWEDSSRLVPNLVRHGVVGELPEFVDPRISRDFVYVDDVTAAFVDTALNLRVEDFGQSFNIGSGRKLAIGEVAAIAREEFGVSAEPAYTMQARRWDVTDWYANVALAKLRLGWEPTVDFPEGLLRTAQWYAALDNKEAYQRSSKQYGLDTKHSVSAIVACYKDGQAIPIMYERLTTVFRNLGLDYEIIFVNDNSPDDSEEVIRTLSARDRRVLGISHSRNFGSQAAFRSGLQVASKNACVLLDGDLQDPPELMEQFVGKWREGYDVVFGRRVKREAPLLMQAAYKLFYRAFDAFSYLDIPHDAGDFSLLDKKVVQAILQFPERDLFLRGIRAYAGFKQTGVDYVRPERMFGKTTNNLAKNIGWAKKGILSYSYAPLTMLSLLGFVLLLVTILLGTAQTLSKVFFPEATPWGITSVLLAIMFFGSFNLFAVSLLGEYIAKIFEEVKQRPHFIRRSIVRDGEVRPASTSLHEN